MNKMKTALIFVCVAICVHGTMGACSYSMSYFSDANCKTPSKTTDVGCKNYKTSCDSQKNAQFYTCKSTSTCVYTFTFKSAMAAGGGCTKTKAQLKKAEQKVDGECTKVMEGNYQQLKFDCSSCGASSSSSAGKGMCDDSTISLMKKTWTGDCKSKCTKCDCSNCVSTMQTTAKSLCKNESCMKKVDDVKKLWDKASKRNFASSDLKPYCTDKCRATFVTEQTSVNKLDQKKCSGWTPDGMKKPSALQQFSYENACVQNGAKRYCLSSEFMKDALKAAKIDAKATDVSCAQQQKFWNLAGCCIGTNAVKTALGSSARRVVLAAPQVARRAFASGYTSGYGSGYTSGYASNYASAPAPAPAPAPTPAKKDPWADTPQSMLAAAKKCNIKINFVPCTGGGASEIARIPASITLSLTAKQFTQTVQEEFKKGIALTAGVQTHAISIISFKESRRAGKLTVNYEVTVVSVGNSGKPAAELAKDIRTKLQDKTTLQKNLRASATSAGSPLKTAKVAAASADSPQVSGTDGSSTYAYDSDGLAAGILALIIIACILAVCVPCLILVCCCGGLACLGIGVAAGSSSGHHTSQTAQV